MSLSPDLDEADQPQTFGRRTGRSFYAAPISEFRITEDDAIIGRLSSRHVAFHAAAEAEQLRAWEREIEILKESFAKLGSPCDDWQLLLEIPLLRLAKRIDAVVLAPGVVGVIEFKINATAFQSADRVQTERYAQSLSDFHEASQQRLLLPILCAERARAKPLSTTLVEGVGTLMEANATTLADALLIVQSHVDRNVAAIDAHGFTYLPMRRGFLYLVAIMDWHTRRVLSWRISNTLEADFCVEALTEAIHKFGPPEIMNTDQGSQFTSFAWTDRLRRSGVRISMDGKDVRKLTLDNIFIERLWRTLKYECVYLHAWETGSETKAAIRKWMTFYNHQRPHSALGGKPPALAYWQRNDITPPRSAGAKSSLIYARSCPRDGK